MQSCYLPPIFGQDRGALEAERLRFQQEVKDVCLAGSLPCRTMLEGGRAAQGAA